MKKTKRVLCLILAMVMVISLTGCGQEEPKKDSSVEGSLDGMVDSVKNKTEESTPDTPSPDPAADQETDQETTQAKEPVVVDSRTPAQKFWGGDWYGILWITKSSGNYEQFNNVFWDAMSIWDVDEAGNADTVFWYKGMSRDNPVAEVQITISGDIATSESGWMFANSDTGNGDVKQGDWVIDLTTDEYSTQYGNGLIHISGYFRDGSGDMYYHFFLRKWGALWDDVVSDEDSEIHAPGFYQDWYKPLVDEGYAMPENILEPGTVKMNDLAAQGAKSDKASDNETPTRKYEGGELVLADDEYCKIVITGMGPYEYNDSWVGYQISITNKADFSMGFYSYAEPNSNEQTWDSIGTGNTCYYKGVICDTHFENVVNAGKTMDDTCLVIDGITDVSQLGEVEGYISITNNETGEVLNNYPYAL